MSWLNDISRLFGSGGSTTTVSNANTTTVSVNPQILTVVDTTPLAASQQALVNSLQGVAPAIASVGTAIKDAAAADQAGTEQLREITILVSIAGIAFALIRMVAAR